MIHDAGCRIHDAGFIQNVASRIMNLFILVDICASANIKF
jgi:hypothetical protein